MRMRRTVRKAVCYVVREDHLLGESAYDLWPMRPEIAVRHFFQLEVPPGSIGTRWEAGEPDPESGGAAASWTCWWLPLPQAHVLAGGLGSLLGRLERTRM